MDTYAGLRHPALVPAVDMFDEADRLVTVTPYMAGGSLDRHQAPFAGRAIGAVMRSLLHCLAYLHARGVVHRDIKPENILLASAAADWPWTARVGDFGFAATLSSGHTGRGDPGGILREVLGTPQFLAPDFFRRHSLSGERLGYGTAVDLWSAGVVLVWMLTGELPFQGAFLVDIVKAARTGAVLPAGLNSVPPAARSLVRGLLQIDPDRRLTALGALHHPYLAEARSEGAPASSTDALAAAAFVSCQLPGLGGAPGVRPCASPLCVQALKDGRGGSVHLPPSHSAVIPSTPSTACTCVAPGHGGGDAASPPRSPDVDEGIPGEFGSTSSRSLRLSSASSGGTKPPLLPSMLRRPLVGGPASRPHPRVPPAAVAATAAGAASPLGQRLSAPPGGAGVEPTVPLHLSAHRSCSENDMGADNGGRWGGGDLVDNPRASLSRLASPSLASLHWPGAPVPSRRSSTLSCGGGRGALGAPAGLAGGPLVAAARHCGLGGAPFCRRRPAVCDQRPTPTPFAACAGAVYLFDLLQRVAVGFAVCLVLLLLHVPDDALPWVVATIVGARALDCLAGVEL
eukprot:TRINITY_DN1417_c0_g3_i1.p1 TRINITY_DN1417_c0_g3~~TRINITY_DN1417_c0_g3_i1.p1  ORF type:complete len:571 (-),score=141.09 TRINITY_DN1417_c0_g3_i1:1038-2750(-)